MHLGYRKTFLIINVLHLVCLRNPSHRIHYGVAHETRRETESVPRAIGIGTSFARDDEQNKGTIPLPMFASRPSTMSSSIPGGHSAESHGWTAKTANIRAAIRQVPHSTFIFCWKMRFKNQVTICSDFPPDAMLWINEVEMPDSSDELKSSRSVIGKNFPNFEMLDAKIASALNKIKIIKNSHFKKKGQSGGNESSKGGSVSMRKTDRFLTIYDYFRVTGARDTVLDHADFFSGVLHDYDIQEFDTRWDEVLSFCVKDSIR